MKQGRALKPAYSSDYDSIGKLSSGEIVECEVRRKRNPLFHRKFFALLNLYYENQETFENFEDLRAYVICKTGKYRRVETPKGVMILPESISFANMDETEFEELFDGALDVISKELQTASEDILNELNEFY